MILLLTQRYLKGLNKENKKNDKRPSDSKIL